MEYTKAILKCLFSFFFGNTGPRITIYIYIYIVCVCVCVCIYYKYILYLSTDRCIHYYKKKSKLLHKLYIYILYIYLYIYKTLPPLHLVQRINQSQWTAISSPGGLSIRLTLEASNYLHQMWTSFLLSVDFKKQTLIFYK